MSGRLPPSTFIRPDRSKAIRIRDPSSAETLPTPVAQKPASTQPVSLYPAAKEPSFTGTLRKSKFAIQNQITELEKGYLCREDNSTTQLSHLPPPRQASHHDGGADERPGQGLDIYARPFVPETLTIINKLDGYEINTPAMKPIDFEAYIRTFIGQDTLRPMPAPVKLPMDASIRPTDSVSPAQYELYFRYLLEAEIQSQMQENAEYSLFGHEVITSFDGFGQTPAACSFSVPGLRENSPYIEEDDIIQLRQLRCDHLGRTLEMEEWLALSRRFDEGVHGLPALARRWPAPGWTGQIYNGRASVVQRKQEQVVVRVFGFVAQNKNLPGKQSISGTHHLKFNVQFPVPEKRYIPMRQALSIVQVAFKHADEKRNHDEETYGITNQSQFDEITDTHRPWLQSMLFPAEIDCEEQTKLNPGYFKRPFFDKELNWEQKKTIESICSNNYGTLPFLISGPPGTGKTKTLVELAAQLVINVDNVSHILVCAPSDPAADTVVQRISIHFGPAELLRLNRPTRAFAEVPGAVLPFCYISQDKFDLPPFRQLMSYKIVVTTVRDSALLLYSRMTNTDLYAAEYGLRRSIHPYAVQPAQVELHWTALLMDESAQAIEPEALIPLSVVAPPESVKLAFTPLFAMAGDEHQLSPRTSLRSSPLKTSLFARLFARPVYSAHPLARSKTGIAPPPVNRSMLPINRPAFANLIRNYRSHPAILAIPSALFYADTLEPEAADTNRLAAWPGWQGRRWPVLFRDNDSEDDLERDGGGWYNKGEARIACTYASLLVKTGFVEQKEICIMTPFKAQVQCLRKMIREKQYALWDIDIGPTEAFQGLERGVVILCTTRSKQRYVESDQKVDWGIIGLPNKMNVALTRAKFGLFVIGKSEILVQDPNWKAFLDFCNRNGLTADCDERFDDSSSTERTRLEKVLMARERDLAEPRFWGENGPDDEMWTSGMVGLNIHEDDDQGDEDYDDHEQEDNNPKDHAQQLPPRRWRVDDTWDEADPYSHLRNAA